MTNAEVVLEEVGGDTLGSYYVAAVPRHGELLRYDDEIYQVQHVIWDYDGDGPTAEVIVQDATTNHG